MKKALFIFSALMMMSLGKQSIQAQDTIDLVFDENNMAYVMGADEYRIPSAMFDSDKDITLFVVMERYSTSMPRVSISLEDFPGAYAEGPAASHGDDEGGIVLSKEGLYYFFVPGVNFRCKVIFISWPRIYLNDTYVGQLTHYGTQWAEGSGTQWGTVGLSGGQIHLILNNSTDQVRLETDVTIIHNNFFGPQGSVGMHVMSYDVPRGTSSFSSWSGASRYTTTFKVTHVGQTFDVSATMGYDSWSTPLPGDPPLYTDAGTVTGSGSYADESPLTVTATPTTGWSFVEWRQFGGVVNGQPASSVGTVVSQDSCFSFTVVKDVTLVAHFHHNMYHVQAVNGRFPEWYGSELERHYGEEYRIVADAAPAGKVFDRWVSANGGILGDVLSASTTYTLPACNDVVTATYKDIVTSYYVLTVNGGSGSGSYEAGTVVNIVADAAPAGKVFDRWVTANGGILGDVLSASTTYTLPACNDVVTATYKDATSIDEISLNEIRIYPNPVKDELHINFPSFENLESLNAQIYDISGRTVGALRATPTDNGTAAINVSNLSSGVYFLKIGDKRVRFVKE